MYVKVTNGTPTAYTIGQLRRDNPSTSFPKRVSDEMLAGYDVYPAVVEARPSYDERTQTISHNEVPTQVDGVWTYGWTVSSKTASEIAEYDASKSASVRSLRDGKLADTDYLALSDNTLTTEMTTYRQALRDITGHANFPYLQDADWPVKP